MEYIDLGYDSGSRKYQLRNVKSNALKKLNNHEYAEIMQNAIKKRMTINGQAYDYNKLDSLKNLHLINNLNGQELVLNQS
jgi:hypothetical protein